MNDVPPGKLVIISGPSGAGKSTAVSKLIDACPLPLKLSVSATTRPIRGDDRPGENYHFLSHEEFQTRVQNGDFVEFVEVFGRGFWYGTLRETVTTGLQQGFWLILEIDVEGAQKVMQQYPDVISIFIHPGSMQELENRLRRRATDDQSAIERRLEVARREMQLSALYKHTVVNKDLDQTVDEICRLLIRYDK